MTKFKKYIISFLGFLILTAGIIAGTYLVSKNQDIREKAAPATSLSFNPSTIVKNAGQTISLAVNANTGENKLTGIDIEVTFDPTVIQMTQMTPTSAIANLTGIIKNGVIDNTTGKARFAAYTADKTQAVSGNMEIINLTGNILSTASNGEYPIAFSATTTIAAADEGQNVIINSTPAILTISPSGGGTATASPIPTATATSSGGVGGSNVILPSATATATSTTRPTSTTKATTTSTARSSATVPPDVPVTGVSYPLIGAMVLGFGAIIFSIFLAF